MACPLQHPYRIGATLRRDCQAYLGATSLLKSNLIGQHAMIV